MLAGHEQKPSTFSNKSINAILYQLPSSDQVPFQAGADGGKIGIVAFTASTLHLIAQLTLYSEEFQRLALCSQNEEIAEGVGCL